jgi:alpha-galactosidase
MKAVGYEYINVDGGWWAGSDTGHVGRNSTGYFEYNQKKFPNGIEAMIKYVHSKGLKYGHYTDSGLKACNKDAPMSEGYEHQDAQLFALQYGVDMVKVDACYATEPAKDLMTRWMQELNKTGRPVVFSNCHNDCQSMPGKEAWQEWCAEVSNMWRSSGDISSTWASVMKNLDSIRFVLLV